MFPPSTNLKLTSPFLVRFVNLWVASNLFAHDVARPSSSEFPALFRFRSTRGNSRSGYITSLRTLFLKKWKNNLIRLSSRSANIIYLLILINFAQRLGHKHLLVLNCTIWEVVKRPPIIVRCLNAQLDTEGAFAILLTINLFIF